VLSPNLAYSTQYKPLLAIYRNEDSRNAWNRFHSNTVCWLIQLRHFCTDAVFDSNLHVKIENNPQLLKTFQINVLVFFYFYYFPDRNRIIQKDFLKSCAKDMNGFCFPCWFGQTRFIEFEFFYQKPYVFAANSQCFLNNIRSVPLFLDFGGSSCSL